MVYHRRILLCSLASSLCAILILLSLSGAANAETARDERFAIYLLSDPSINATSAVRQDINSLRLSNTPLITASELDTYYWDEHVIRLASDNDRLPTIEGIGVHGLPFVVAAKGKRIYVGAFWLNISSVSFPEPVILAAVPWYREAGVYEIRRAYPDHNFAQGPDPRGDPLIKEALKEAGKIDLEGMDPSIREVPEGMEKTISGQ